MRLLTCFAAASLVLSSTACQEQREDAQNAVEAAKALSDLAQGAKESAAKMEQAAAEAEKEAAAQIPEGTDPEVAKQQIEMAKSMAAMKAMGGGAAVNWRQLKPFLPEKIGDFTASGELDGSTNKVAGGMQVTTVKRNYKAGEQRLKVEINDAFTAPFLRAPFAMAAMIEEDSTRGYKKGKKLEGHTAIVEWKEKSKRSHVVLLVADRFVVNVTINNADKDDAAERLAKQLSLSELAEVKPEAEESEG